MLKYLEERELPDNEKEATRITRESHAFEVIKGVLYRIQPDKTLLLYLPEEKRHEMFDEAHSGMFAGHQQTAKIYSTLSRHYWWPRMRRDVEALFKSCSTCTERRAGPAAKLMLTPLPVAGLFDRM